MVEILEVDMMKTKSPFRESILKTQEEHMEGETQNSERQKFVEIDKMEGLKIKNIEEEVLAFLPEYKEKIVSLPYFRYTRDYQGNVEYSCSYFGCTYCINLIQSTKSIDTNKNHYECFADKIKKEVLEKHEVIARLTGMMKIQLAPLSHVSKFMLLWYVFLKDCPEGLMNDKCFFNVGNGSIPPYDFEYMDKMGYVDNKKGEIK